MAWTELNIAEGKLNMSKSVPYTPELDMLDTKLGYWHNNRLTAINKWITNSAVGYKCYKRKANSSHLVDNELTDYIEINKITESGSIVHMLDVADTYYKCESENTSLTSTDPNFYSGVILDDTYIGTATMWSGYNFYTLNASKHLYLAYSPTAKVYRYLYCKQTKNSDYTNNVTITEFSAQNSSYLFDSDKSYIFKNAKGLFICENPGLFKNYWDQFQGSYSCGYGYKTETDPLIMDQTVPFKYIGLTSYSAVDTTAQFLAEYKQIENDTGTYSLDVTYDRRVYIGDSTTSRYQIYEYYVSSGSTAYDSGNYNHRGHYQGSIYIHAQIPSISTEYKYSNNQGLTAWTDSGTTHYFNCQHYYTGTTTTALEITPAVLNTSGVSLSDYNNTPEIATQIHWDLPNSDKYWSDKWNVNPSLITTESYEIKKSLASNYTNDSVIQSNGFVVNYWNKIPVSLGHKYKVIARFDTQGAGYLGSDSTYSYVENNTVKYKISLAKMYPDVAYDSEVNIIDNGTYCKQVNGYKIFNTTTYYNAIYDDNPDKICCSCDDWNGRYYSTTDDELAEANLKSNSRVGNQWNATASWSDIPNKAISDELADTVNEFANPTFHWTNTKYTIHNGTTAYIYRVPDTQENTLYRYYKVSYSASPSDADFTSDYLETDVFNENSPVELVPSILFTDYLKSDVNNLIQIGSEMYKLKTYTYSSTVPALVYQSTAESINIDPSSEEIVIQGAYYTISGASSFRKITNPYDTTGTYCCDVTGLKYIGYDSSQAYFYSPATGVIYTFTGDNKLTAYIEVDKRVPKNSNDASGIEVCNIPSINLVAMAFTDGVLVIVNGQSLFIPQQSITDISVNREYGILRINGSYYYFGTNTGITSLIAASGGKTIVNVDTLPNLSTLPAAEKDVNSKLYDYSNRVYYLSTDEKYYAVLVTTVSSQTTYSWRTVDSEYLTGSSGIVEAAVKTCKIGNDRLTNITCNKHRVCIYNDTQSTATLTITINTKLGNEIKTYTYTKLIPYSNFIDNEYQFEISPKYTKFNWCTVEIQTKNADLLNYYVNIAESAEEYLVR